MSDLALIEKELTEILTKNLEKFRLQVVIDVVQKTIKKYFDNYADQRQ